MYLFDWIVFCLYFLDFVFGVVFSWIGYGVIVVVISDYFQDVWFFVVLVLFECFFRCCFDCMYVYVVDLFIWNVKGGIVLGKICGCRGVGYVGVYVVFVVFDYIDDWQFLQFGYIEVFIDLVLVGCVIVEECYCDVVVVLVFVGKFEFGVE